ncbi:MAG: tetratricopeptide repeat protein, partial [Rhodospirillaceae bacterium]|nr:tetratricopeptide repeat protein [Rhodospirillaceae bacterium]
MALSPAIARKLDNALAQHRAGQLELAEVLYREVIAEEPMAADAHHLWGVIAQVRRNFGASADRIARAIELDPANPRYHVDFASAMLGLNRLDDVLPSLDRAVELGPEGSDNWVARGVYHARCENLQLALSDLNRAMALQPEDPLIQAYRGQVLYKLQQLAQAAHSFSLATTLHPENPEYHYLLGLVQQDLGQWIEARDSFQNASALNPSHPYVLGAALKAKMDFCAWESFDDDTDDILSRIDKGELVTAPHTLLHLPASLDQLRLCADIYARTKFTLPMLPFVDRKRYGEKIRVGYFSPHFRTHHIAMALARIVEGTDRSKFEVYGFSYGVQIDDPWRKRLEGIFDQFIDVSHVSDPDVVKAARDMDLDIAVDLAGYGPDARPGIFVSRIAPVQIGLFGYPATLGQNVLDYVVADATVIPEGDLASYAEKIIFMPDGYTVTDRKRTAPPTLTRADVGLGGIAPNAFVFAAFYSAPKLNPDIFDVWLNILRNAPNAVLWLMSETSIQTENLTAYAAQRGIGLDRLIFAGPAPHDAHIARLAVADCVLDTLPFNGNASTVDALFAGVPVLTCTGRTYAGRLGASLVKMAGVPDLIASSLVEYEMWAVRFTQQPEIAQTLKKYLTATRGRS